MRHYDTIDGARGTIMRGTQGRHRRGTPGLVWCGDLPAVAAALARPEIARRGLVERFLATARHVRPVRAAAGMPFARGVPSHA